MLIGPYVNGAAVIVGGLLEFTGWHPHPRSGQSGVAADVWFVLGWAWHQHR